MIQTLNKHDIQKLEEYWSKHKENKKMLKFREWELTSRKTDDENTGGSSSGYISNPTERDGGKLAEDQLYQNLKRIIKVVEDLYDEADEDLKTIVSMRYWDDDANCYEWEDIADKLFMSRSKVLRKRNALLDETAERIGWV